MRKSIKIAAIGCGVPLLLLAAGAGWLAWKLRSAAPFVEPPELARNLPRNYLEARVAFEKRVAARFSVGSREADLVAELKRQGFSLRQTNAHFTRRELVCTHDWHISWKPDSQARIQSVASYYYMACL